MRSEFGMGFTLIELVIVVTILAILALVAIPTFQNMQKHAKDAATKGILGNIRSAIHTYRMNEIASGRRPGTPGVSPDNGCPGPELLPMEQFGTAVKVMERGIIPDNPWMPTDLFPGQENWILPYPFGAQRGSLAFSGSRGWAYQTWTCEFWANTALNGDPPCDPCVPGCTSENCF